MNFRRYHVSKNLFIQKLSGATIALTGEIVSDVNYDTYIAEVSNGETYTVSNVTGTQVFGFFTTKPTLGTITYNSSRTIFSTPSQTFTVPTGENIKYVGIRYNTGVSNAMLNTGSTPQPYEPYSAEIWHSIPYYQHKTATDTLTLPTVLYPTGTTATVGLKGQTTQSSIPSPTSPVMPQGTGERTGNLAPPLTEWVDGYIIGGVDGGNLHTPTASKEKASDFIEVLPNTTYTFSFETGNFIGGKDAWRVIAEYNERKEYITRPGGAAEVEQVLTTSSSTKYLRLSYRSFGSSLNTMLNAGSTALPYEPWGIKIPILLNSQTINKYLGTEQTVRQIKKLVLTGQESWNKGNYPPTGGYQFFTAMPADIATNFDWITTHFKNGIGLNGSIINGSAFAIYLSLYPEASILPENATANDFKAWLAAQYAAGTPVTVWYVLATPTTGITNEPLMKIGNYADSLTTSIPCTAGENTLDVQTTVQPSEVTATFEGWHPVTSAHERENGAWA